MTIHLPNSWNFIIFFNKLKTHYNIYLYDKVYFFYFSLHYYSHKIFYDKFEQTIFIKTNYRNHFFSLFWLLFFQVFYSFSFLFFGKIKFQGKGYYIYKNKRNTITPKFGFAHRIFVYSFNINVFFLTKTKIFLFGVNLVELNKIRYQIFNIKPINIFTGRGMRFAKQIIYKKQGKISEY